MALSRTQSAILKFVGAYLTKHGHAPTIRQIQQGCGFRSTSKAHYGLAGLRRAGLVAGCGRGLTVVQRVQEEPVCPSCGSAGPFEVLVPFWLQFQWDERMRPVANVAAALKPMDGLPNQVNCATCGLTFKAKPWAGMPRVAYGLNCQPG